MRLTPITLSTAVDQVHLIGHKHAQLLKKMGIYTAYDLLNHFPFRYEDYSLVVPIASVQPGETVTIQGTVETIRNEFTKKGLRIQKAKVADESGSISVVFFNQPFLLNTLRPGLRVSLAGKVDWFGHGVVMESPEYEIIRNQRSETRHSDFRFLLHTGRLVPIYPESKGISSKWLRSRIALLLQILSRNVNDPLPQFIIERFKLLSFAEALTEIHFPKNIKKANSARERLAFDELLTIQLASHFRKKTWQKQQVAHRLYILPHKQKLTEFYQSLPFTLTSAQKRAIGDILSDLAKENPMNRLLEGDVGSGKTVVATVAMYLAHLNGFQSVLMAPTEILSYQHYQTVSQLMHPFGVNVRLLTGSSPRKRKEKNLDARRYFLGADITIGTHALISPTVSFEKLALVVIDEQHRFGVEQRATLREKGVNPHLLTVTATPIPRTVALTLYGELDISFLDELPKGRKKVKTYVIPPEKRNDAYQWIRNKIKDKSEQAFIICPLIEESESLTTVRAAKKEYQRLKKDIFADLKLSLLHGKQKTKEKEKILTDFKRGKYHLLVATPVVEVGIDIPSATIMMIEAADRFGLAQLHQLRGRVGRGKLDSYCLLFTESTNDKIINRLKSLERIHVGSTLAELDLKLRGPGEVFGTRQHGMINLKVASLDNRLLITQTKEATRLIINRDSALTSFPLLKTKVINYKIKSVAQD